MSTNNENESVSALLNDIETKLLRPETLENLRKEIVEQLSIREELREIRQMLQERELRQKNG